MSEKDYRDKNGYWRGNPEHSDQISRQIAHKEIYLKDRDKYPLSFREYVVHHIDTEKNNNSVKNLYLCTQKEHELIHSYQKENKTKFKSAKEIDIFLINKRAEGNTKIDEFEKKDDKKITNEKLEITDEELDEIIDRKVKEESPKKGKIIRLVTSTKEIDKIIKRKHNRKLKDISIVKQEEVEPSWRNPLSNTLEKEGKKEQIELKWFVPFLLLILVGYFVYFKAVTSQEILVRILLGLILIISIMVYLTYKSQHEREIWLRYLKWVLAGLLFAIIYFRSRG